MTTLSPKRNSGKAQGIALLFTALLPLTGCVVRNVDPGAGNPIGNYPGLPFSGMVTAATMPIAGASVQLYAAGSTGNASAPSPLLASPLTTDQNGRFSVGQYSCPFDVSVLYLVARGGTVATAGASNSGSVLVTTLGRCRDIGAHATFITNELTTVSSAYAMAPFAAPGAVIGSSATNQAGIAIAAANATTLVSPTTGSLPGVGFPANGTAPTARINTFADALNACIVQNSAGAACLRLYQAAIVSGNEPTNTFDAVLNIAQNPAHGSPGIFQASGSSAAFTPTLQAAPADWTMPVTFTGGGMSAPTTLAIDTTGRVWVSSYFNVASLFTNAGAPIVSKGISGSGLNKSFGLAVDSRNNAWIANEQSDSKTNNGFGSITVLDSAGNAVSATNGYAQGGLNYPVSIFIDTNDTAWIVNSASSTLSLINTGDGSSSADSGYSNALLVSPVAVRTDSKHFGYIADQASQTIVRVAPDGSSFTAVNCCDGASGLAIDQNDNIWVANYYGNSISQIDQNFNLVAPGYKDPSINHPQGIAVDGGGGVWVANYLGKSLTHLAGSSAPAPGSILSSPLGLGSDAGLLQPYSIAIDSAGSLWVSNMGSNTLTKFIGLAAPVKTPLIGPVATP